MDIEGPEIKVNDQFCIRVPRESDGLQLSQVIDDNRKRLREWLPWVDESQGSVDTTDYIKRVLTGWALKRIYAGLIFRQDEIVGGIGFHNLQYNNTSIGYWVAEKYCRKGVGTLAAKALINWAFHFYPELHLVELRAASKNSASRRIAEKLKMKHEGVLRDREWLYDHYVDHEIYSVTRAEWKSSGFHSELATVGL